MLYNRFGKPFNYVKKTSSVTQRLLLATPLTFLPIALYVWLLILFPANCIAKASADTLFFKEQIPSTIATLVTDSSADQYVASVRNVLRGEEDSLALATSLMTSKQSKSAIAVTSPLLDKLKKEGRYTSPFGLKARFVHGSALIHADMNRAPLDFLWELKDDSQASGQWDIFAETCRVIASILAYSGRPEQALQNLREAQATIKKHQLDSVYPHFAVRISSWHRIFGNRDSSVFLCQGGYPYRPAVWTGI